MTNREGQTQMPLFNSHSGSERLRCPYRGCERAFDKPTVLTDAHQVPRQSYYACPHCMSKIDIITQDMRIIGVKPTEYPAKVFDSPAKCAHFSGTLNTRPENAPLPDECLVCPKVLQCDARKK